MFRSLPFVPRIDTIFLSTRSLLDAYITSINNEEDILIEFITFTSRNSATVTSPYDINRGLVATRSAFFRLLVFPNVYFVTITESADRYILNLEPLTEQIIEDLTSTLNSAITRYNHALRQSSR